MGSSLGFTVSVGNMGKSFQYVAWAIGEQLLVRITPVGNMAWGLSINPIQSKGAFPLPEGPARVR